MPITRRALINAASRSLRVSGNDLCLLGMYLLDKSGRP